MILSGIELKLFTAKRKRFRHARLNPQNEEKISGDRL